MAPIAAKAGICSAMRPWAETAGLMALTGDPFELSSKRARDLAHGRSLGKRPNGVIGQLDADEESEREDQGVEPIGRHPPHHPDAGECRYDRDRKEPGGHNKV